MSETDVQLRVDWIRCDGYGLCGDLMPGVIELDEWSYPIVRPGPIEREDLHDAQRAADCCPMKALTLHRVPVVRVRPSCAPGRARPRSG